MFISNETYLEELKKLIASSDKLICAVAFWGRGAEQLFIDTAADGRTLKIICNLQSGATNPDVIANLLQYAEAKQHVSLHAKVIAGNNRAIVGSANFSCNGLNLEGEEQGGWNEAGIITETETEIKSIKKWFDDLWEVSTIITDEDIKEAKIFWKKRRGNRPWTQKQKRPLLDTPLLELKDRPIYLAIYREHFGEIEVETLEGVREREGAGIELSAYGNWGDLLQNLEENALLIDLYYGSRGGLTYEGTHTILNGWIEPIVGMEGGLQMCRKATIPNLRFNQEDARNLCRILRPAMEIIWESRREDYESIVIQLYEALKISRNL